MTMRIFLLTCAIFVAAMRLAKTAATPDFSYAEALQKTLYFYEVLTAKP
jgi:hypothetical protein